MMGSLPGCCARAAFDQAAIPAAPSPAMNSRRCMCTPSDSLRKSLAGRALFMTPSRNGDAAADWRPAGYELRLAAGARMAQDVVSLSICPMHLRSYNRCKEWISQDELLSPV